MESLVPVGIVGLIFGGCCSNVFALEAIVKEEPDSGLLITLGQFVLVCLSVLPSQIDISQPYLLKRGSVPFRKWVASAAMFFAVNMLNNWAFAFQISVPVHIILRSFGSVTTMGAGWLKGKKYSSVQVISVAILTLGVMVSAWADAQSQGKSLSATPSNLSTKSFASGLAILLVAQLLSAYMGIYVQDIYAAHGKAWDENLFYSHLLSLPMFLPLAGTLTAQYARLTASPPLLQTMIPLLKPLKKYLGIEVWHLPIWLVKMLDTTPRAMALLTLNSLTQLACISGVNLLSANTSAVTVTIVLNIRKLVSFMFSIWLFGNPMSQQMVLGAVLVFGAGALYGWETTVGIKRRTARQEKAATKTEKSK